MKKITFDHEVHINPVAWALFSILVLIVLNHVTSWQSDSLFSVWAEAFADTTSSAIPARDMPGVLVGALVVVGVPCAAAAVGGWVLAALFGVLHAFIQDIPRQQPANARRERIVVAFLLTASLLVTFLVVKTLLG